MPNYDFIATDHHGRNFKGLLSGPTEDAVYSKLQKLGYVVLSINQREKKESVPFLVVGVSPDDIVVFSKLLSTVISASVPVNEALIALEEQINKYPLKKALREIRAEVESGVPLSAAFSKYPRMFPGIFISMIRSGELSGNLPDALDRLASYLEKDQEIKRSIKSAFLYPKTIMILATFAIIYLLTTVVPRFIGIYQQANMTNKLTWPTKTLIFLSNFVTSHGYYLLGGVGAVFCFILYLKYNTSKRHIYDRMIMSIPIFGGVMARLSIARTVRSLGSMLECGVPILDSLETSKLVLDNKLMEEDIDRAIENVELGGNISTPLRMSRHFPPVVIYMTAAGERSGRLHQLLQKCADAMEKELEHIVKRMLIMFEVALIVAIAAIIGFIAIAVYMPIFEIVTGGGKM